VDFALDVVDDCPPSQQPLAGVAASEHESAKRQERNEDSGKGYKEHCCVLGPHLSETQFLLADPATNDVSGIGDSAAQEHHQKQK
jgi:hypothetical protein